MELEKLQRNLVLTMEMLWSVDRFFFMIGKLYLVLIKLTKIYFLRLALIFKLVDVFR